MAATATASRTTRTKVEPDMTDDVDTDIELDSDVESDDDTADSTPRRKRVRETVGSVRSWAGGLRERADAKEAAQQKKRGNRPGPGVLLAAGFLRLTVLIVDYLIIISTAMVILPMMGAWMHAQSGVGTMALTSSGTIAIWVIPLMFLMLMIAAGELVVMRGLWRWSSRRIDALIAARTPVSTTTETSTVNRASSRRAKSNGSKRSTNKRR